MGSALAAVLACAVAPGAEPPAADGAAIQRSVDRAAAYLEKVQTPEGAFAPQTGTGVTAIVVTGLLRNGRTANDPVVAKSLKYLEGLIQPDGRIAQPTSLYGNYETCLAMMVFQAANRDGRYDKALKNAESFIKQEQWDDGEGAKRNDVRFGGAGYGRNKRPDLSNTQFFVEALREIGRGPDDEAIQKALVFVSRCQNLESENNTTAFPAKNPDGGFYYTPVGEGESFAGKLPNGGLRSYGSMTYAGLKSMIYAGVGPDDPRVKAAVEWIKKNFSLETNPGIGDAGTYYYYHTFAKALDVLKQDTITDDKGVSHDWRKELASELIHRQRADGSWVNANARWMEGDPTLVTGYALLSLSYCRPQATSKPAK
jgi:squalene-hopene/tetraprenyl-beta-curcumene cyclase